MWRYTSSRCHFETVQNLSVPSWLTWRFCNSSLMIGLSTEMSSWVGLWLRLCHLAVLHYRADEWGKIWNIAPSPRCENSGSQAVYWRQDTLPKRPSNLNQCIREGAKDYHHWSQFKLVSLKASVVLRRRDTVARDYLGDTTYFHTAVDLSCYSQSVAFMNDTTCSYSHIVSRSNSWSRRACQQPWRDS